ncbi:Undecaprenyl phosphate-alpha-4-amino-4-deoxy-L-arabinose arabinosyl transferase [Trichinella pseudospiralis]
MEGSTSGRPDIPDRFINYHNFGSWLSIHLTSAALELSLLHLQFSNLFPPREPTASGEHATPPRSVSFYREQP